MGYWYVAFVRTGLEDKVIGHINCHLNSKGMYAFRPWKEKVFRRKGVDNIIREVMFPGYVFIETDKEYADVYNEIRAIFQKFNIIVALLNYGERRYSALHWEEQERLREMFGNGPDYCLKKSVGVMVGNKITILSGPLAGKEGTIRKINRHKRLAVIDMMLFNEPREVTVALEIVSRQ